MLVGRAQVKPGDNVLVWGAAGGLGSFALQICRLLGANPIAVVSSADKYDMVRSLGASGVVNRKDFDFAWSANETPERTKRRLDETKRLGSELRKLCDGRDPDVVFEHVGQETFPASVFLCKRFGKIVICGATSGFNLEFDVRYLWMRQKEILGSHFANAYQAERANELVAQGKIKPVLDQVFDFTETATAHQLMMENKHKGKLGIRIQAPQ
jgi:crotonyl-CoA carboxylase/reductase